MLPRAALPAASPCIHMASQNNQGRKKAKKWSMMPVQGFASCFAASPQSASCAEGTLHAA